jgi:hypothetical protein
LLRIIFNLMPEFDTNTRLLTDSKIPQRFRSNSWPLLHENLTINTASSSPFRFPEIAQSRCPQPPNRSRRSWKFEDESTTPACNTSSLLLSIPSLHDRLVLTLFPVSRNDGVRRTAPSESRRTVPPPAWTIPVRDHQPTFVEAHETGEGAPWTASPSYRLHPSSPWRLPSPSSWLTGPVL